MSKQSICQLQQKSENQLNRITNSFTTISMLFILLIKKALLLANDIRQNFNELLHRRSSKQQSEEVSVEELPPKENLD